MKTSNNLLRDSIAALRGVGSGITRKAHEPAPKRGFLRSVRLALEPLATVPGGF